MRRSIELPALPALGAGKLREEVFVDPSEDVLGASSRRAETDVADKVDQLPEPLLVEAKAGIILRQNALE
jgi:hypothetical protein